MAQDLAALAVQLELQSAAFNKGMDKASKQLTKFDKRAKTNSKSLNLMSGSMRQLARLGPQIATAIAAAFSVQSLRNAVAYADNLDKTSQKLGISVEALQEFRFAADKAGISTQTMDMALQRFARRTGEAAQGTGVMADVYDQLGISLKDTEGNMKSVEALFLEYADGLAQVRDHTDQMVLANKAFDAEGTIVVNMLKNGADAVRIQAERLQLLNGVMSGDTVAKAAVLTDAFSDMATVLKTQLYTILIETTAAVAEFFGLNFTEQQTIKDMEKVGKQIIDIQKKIAAEREKVSEVATRPLAEQNIRLLSAELEGLIEEEALLRLAIEKYALERKKKQDELISAKELQNLITFKEEMLNTVDPARKLQQQIDLVNVAIADGFDPDIAARFVEIITEAATGEKARAQAILDTLDPLEAVRRKQQEVNDLIGVLPGLTKEAAEAYNKFLEGQSGVQLSAAEEVQKITDDMETQKQRLIELKDAWVVMWAKAASPQQIEFIKQQIQSIVEQLAQLTGTDYKINIFVPGDAQVFSTIKELGASLGNYATDMQAIGRDLIGAFSHRLADALVEGDQSFKQFATNFLKLMAKMILQAILLRSIMGAFGMNPDGSPITVGVAAPAPPSGGGGGTGPLGLGGALSRTPLAVAHVGGTPGVLMAPSYGSRPMAAQKAGVQINVTNNSSSGVDIQQRETNDGITIDMLIEDKVNKSILGGGLDRTMESTYGVRRRAF